MFLKGSTFVFRCKDMTIINTIKTKSVNVLNKYCLTFLISPITPSKSFIHKDLAKNNISLHLSHISPFISPVIIAVMQMFGDCKVKAERRDEGRDMGEMKIRRSLYLRAFQPIDGRDGRLLVKTLRYSSTRHACRCYPSVFNQHHQFL